MTVFCLFVCFFFIEMVKDEVEKQARSLLADEFVKLNIVPVHRTINRMVVTVVFLHQHMLHAWHTCQIQQLFNLTFLK